MLEFALVAPLFIALMLVIVDISRLMLVTAGANDAAYAAARAAAQSGLTNSTATQAWDTAFSQIPFRNGASYSNLRITPSRCTSASPHVEATANVSVPMVTPGLWQLLGNPGNAVTVRAAAVVRCEVTR